MINGKSNIRRWCVPLIIAMVLVGSGCAAKYRGGLPPSFQAEVPPAEYEQSYAKLEREGERNWVLNLQSIAMHALRRGDYELAKRAFDEALLQIEVIYGDSPQARRARSIWFEEKSKIFKGDPYERSMMYFYRGILYMHDKDWDNARAAFRSAQIQDAFVEEQQHRGDWAIFDYMIGVCELQLGDLSSAEDALALACETYEEVNPDAPPLPLVSREDNLLVITQHGRAPRKVAEGPYKQYQAYRQGDATDSGAAVMINGTKAGKTVLADSVFYQATTRGGREVDKILGRQAVVKGATEETGEVAMVAGGVLLLDGLEHNNKDAATVGLLALAIGGASYGFSTLVKPQADVRYMQHLPDALGIWAGELSPGEYEVGVNYLNPSFMNQSDYSVPLSIRKNGKINVLLVFPPPEPVIVYPHEETPKEVKQFEPKGLQDEAA